MSLPFLGQLTSVPDQLSREATSALGSLSHLAPSGWASAIAFLMLLPLVGIFVRPLLRLSGAVTNSAAAIGSALIVCVSSWAVILIQHVTALAYALRPSPQLEPVLRVAVPVGIVSFLVYRSIIPLPYLAGAIISVLLIIGALRLSRGGNSRLKQKVSSVGIVPVTIGAGILAGIISLAAYSLYNSNQSLHTCLIGGKIQQECLEKLNAQRF